MMRRLALVLSVAVAFAVPVAAQDRETLADIRQQLTVLFVELQRLKQELNTTGTAGGTLSGGTALDRVGAIESELVRLTAKTEQLENRINRIVADGTNRVGDLEALCSTICEPGWRAAISASLARPRPLGATMLRPRS